jgi:glycosyltransferase involved in cell wall biosynthesis
MKSQRERYSELFTQRNSIIGSPSSPKNTFFQYPDYPIKDMVYFAQKENYTIGVGITTHNRYEVFSETYKRIKQFLPKNAKLVVVDDASNYHVKEATFRFMRNVGVAAAKNKCLELLEGCDYIFLFDDDCYPVRDKWWEPYIKSGIHHLSFTFERTKRGRNGNDKITSQYGLSIYKNPCGCMLFYTKECIEKVGGFNLGFGKYGHEHVDHSIRIYNAGLIHHPFVDIDHSFSLFYSGDYNAAVSSSVSGSEKKIRNEWLKGKEGYLPYKTSGEPFTVVGSYFTYRKDPQRGIQWKPDFGALKDWIYSVVDCGGNVILIHDCFNNLPKIKGVKYIKYEGVNEYSPTQYRWIVYSHIIEHHVETDVVFFTDCTDVICLKAPQVESGFIYAGDEFQQKLNSKWMIDNHNSILKIPDYVEFTNSIITSPLLNAGIVGGKTDTIIHFINKSAEYNTKYGKTESSTDMGIFNYVLYKYFSNIIKHGGLVNTRFKYYELNNHSWFQHK